MPRQPGYDTFGPQQPPEYDDEHLEEEMEDTKRVEFMPNMPKDEEGQKAIMKILEARDQQDYQCYLILQDLLVLGAIPNIPENGPADMQDLAGLHERATDAVDKRVELNDKFLKMMAGG